MTYLKKIADETFLFAFGGTCGTILMLPLLIGMLLLSVGCKSIGNTVTPALVQSSVNASVRFGVEKYPTALPAVKVGVEVICSMANSTNISPAVIVAAVESSEWKNLKTPEAVFIMQGIITVYSVAWNSFGSEAVANSESMKGYLQAVCNGGTEALSGRPRTTAITQWPQLRFR